MRLIDADALVEYFEGLARSLANARCFNAADAIKGAAEKVTSAPTIDAEPVVRCKDCKERCPESATSVQHCTLSGIQTEDDDFCSYGAKMDGGTEC